MEATHEIQSIVGVVFLTQSMKDALNSGIEELLTSLRLESFKYFQYHEFEPTPEIIPIMRNVVNTAIRKGVI